MRHPVTLSLALILVLAALSASFAGEDEKEQSPSVSIFTVKMRESDREYDGVLKMHFEKKLSGVTEIGRIDISFDRIEKITPTEDGKRIKVKLVTGEEPELTVLNSLYLVNEVYGNIDLDLTKVESIVRKQ